MEWLGSDSNLFLANPVIAGITTGIVMMLFMAKIQKPYAVFILAILAYCTWCDVETHTYIVLIHTIIIMVIAELLRKKVNINLSNIT